MATVLIIESDLSIAAMLAAVVESVGATPVFEPDPAGAAPDVLLIDPLAHGAVEMAVALRAASPELPIVSVSARAPEPEVRQLLEPAVFLPKPFAVSVLSAAISTLLPRR